MPAHAAPSAPPSARFVPALEGVRGIAQAMIMFYHYLPLALPWAGRHLLGHYVTSAWVAVDLFFVLSGFLITGILLDHRPARNFFRSFYARRVLRIFPLYWSFLLIFLVLLPAALGAVAFDGPYPDLAQLRAVARDQLWFWAYLSNFWQVRHGFPGNGLGIIWTLAIEEQFYLVWPLLVYLAPAPRRLGPVCLAIAGGSMAVRAWLAAGRHMQAAYFLTICHTDALALGALAAVALRSSWRARVARGAPWLSLILAAIFAVRLCRAPLVLFTFDAFAYWLPLWNAFSAALIVTLATRDERHPVARVFGSAPLMWAGRHSYSMYLWHLPAHQVAAAYVAPVLGDDPWLLAAAATALCLAVSVLTHRGIERPFLRLKRRFPYDWRPAPPSSASSERSSS